MATIRQLVTEIRFLISQSSLADVKAKIAEVKRELNGISTAKVKVEADRTSFATAREAISGLKRQLSSVRDTVVNVRVRRSGGEGGYGGGHGGERHEHGHNAFTEGLIGIGSILGMEVGLREMATLSNEWAAMSANIKNATKDQNEFVQSREALIKVARETRTDLESASQLFVNMKIGQKDTGLSDEQIMRNVRSVTEALALGHRTPVQNRRASRQLDEMISTGKLQSRHLQSLAADNQYLYNALLESAGGHKALEAFMKSKNNNSKGIADLVSKMGPIIDRQFKNLPITFGSAMQSIRTDMEITLGKIFVDTGMVSDALKPIVGVFDWIVDSTGAAADALGGYRNLAIAVSDVVLGFLTAAIAKTTVWAVRMAIIEAPWIMLAAAVAAVGLAVQDVWVWMHGGESVSGRLLGSFQLWKPAIDSAVQSARDFAMSFVPTKEAIQSVWQTLVSYPWKAQLDSIGLNWKNIKQFVLDVGDAITENFHQIQAIIGLGKDRSLKGWIDGNFSELRTVIDWLTTIDKWLNKINGMATGAGKFVHDNLVAPIAGALGLGGGAAVGAAPTGGPASGGGIFQAPLLPRMSPSVLSPSNSFVNTHAPVMNNNITNNITATSSAPAAIAAAASQGTSQGVTTSLGSSMRSFRQSIAPAAEAGVAY